MKKIDMKIDCKTCRNALADLLLDESYAAAHPEVAEHMAACAECRKELEELQATFALLDDWTRRSLRRTSIASCMRGCARRRLWSRKVSGRGRARS
jgi:anti-sigma factor RsiW